MVKTKDGIGEVIFEDKTIIGGRDLYSFNGGKYFVTSEHPFMTKEGWKSINPEATKFESEELYNQLVGSLQVGDIVKTEDDWVELKTIDIQKTTKSDFNIPLYNFHVENQQNYYADGYLVHNK